MSAMGASWAVKSLGRPRFRDVVAGLVTGLFSDQHHHRSTGALPEHGLVGVAKQTTTLAALGGRHQFIEIARLGYELRCARTSHEVRLPGDAALNQWLRATRRVTSSSPMGARKVPRNSRCHHAFSRINSFLVVKR